MGKLIVLYAKQDDQSSSGMTFDERCDAAVHEGAERLVKRAKTTRTTLEELAIIYSEFRMGLEIKETTEDRAVVAKYSLHDNGGNMTRRDQGIPENYRKQQPDHDLGEITWFEQNELQWGLVVERTTTDGEKLYATLEQVNNVWQGIASKAKEYEKYTIQKTSKPNRRAIVSVDLSHFHGVSIGRIESDGNFTEYKTELDFGFPSKRRVYHSSSCKWNFPDLFNPDTYNKQNGLTGQKGVTMLQPGTDNQS